MLKVLHVLLDEPGGAKRTLDVIEANLGEGFETRRLLMDPRALRWPSPSFLRARRALKAASGDADVVHAHGVRAGVAVRLARPRNAAVVVTVHGLHALRRATGLTRLPARIGTRLSLRKAACVIALSESDRKSILSQGLAPAENVVLSFQAFTPLTAIDRAKARADLDLDHENNVVLWGGRFVEQKDPEAFVRAATSRSVRGVNLMVGDGPLLARSKELAAKIGADVRFVGWREDLSAYLSAADVFVSTARWEGFPLMLLEAASAGGCLVATDVVGNRDVAGMGIPVALVPPEDSASLALTIDALLEDHGRRRQMASEASSVAGELAKRAASTQLLEEIYQRVAGGRPQVGYEERLRPSETSHWWGEHRSRYRFASRFAEGRVVLDVACGSGFGSEMLADAGAHFVVAVDVSLEAAREARVAVGDRAGVFASDGTRLGLKSGSIDLVASFETLEHVEDQEVFLDEVRRVLAPGGLLVVSTPNALVTRPIEGKPRNPFHTREFTPAELEDLLRPRFSNVELLGQRMPSVYRFTPLVELRRDMPRDLATRMSFSWWRLQHKMPFAIKERFSRLLHGRSFYPGEDDWLFTHDGIDGAHVLVAVCRP